MNAPVLVNISMHVEFNLPRFTRSKDMMGPLNQKRVTWPWPLLFEGRLSS